MKTQLTASIVFFLIAHAGAAQTARQPVFISPGQLDVAALLPSPPASAAELAELHRIQDSRTPGQIAHAKADEAEEDIFVFREVVGDNFKPDLLPLTAVLSAHVQNDEGLIVNPAKAFFHRPRPYRFDATLAPPCKVSTKETDYSYPGGHATTGYLEALVMMMIVPEKRDAILARADDYAHSRLVCAAHYPADLAASKSVAYAMMGIMINNPQFKKELEAARAETRHALGL
jgi:acid phosphatase (class A)